MTGSRYRAVLSRPDFRLLWVGATVSTLGDAMTVVALTWLVFSGSGSAGVGWLIFTFGAPVVVGGLLTGRVLARFGAVRSLFVDSVVRAGVVGTVPIAWLLGGVPLWLPFVVAGCYGLAKMLPLAGVPTMIPDLVECEQVNTANALEMLSYGAGTITGPALAGLAISFTAPAYVLAADAVTFLIFAACLARMRAREVARPAAGPGASVAEALRFAMRGGPVRTTTLMFSAANIGLGILGVLMPIYAVDVLHTQAGGYGALGSAFALGELTGSVAVGSRPARGHLGRAIAVAQLATGVTIGALLLRPGLVGACLVVAVTGAVSAPMTVWAQTLRMSLVPPHLRGHVFALLRTTMQAGSPVGGAIGGATASGSVTAATVMTVAWIALPGAVGSVTPSLSSAWKETFSDAVEVTPAPLTHEE